MNEIQEEKEKLIREVCRYFLKTNREDNEELQCLLEMFYKLNKSERVEVLITAFETLIEEHGLYDFSKQIKETDDDDFGVIFEKCDEIEDFISTHFFLLKQII